VSVLRRGLALDEKDHTSHLISRRSKYRTNTPAAKLGTTALAFYTVQNSKSITHHPGSKTEADVSTGKYPGA
jgi:hypothetical protein